MPSTLCIIQNNEGVFSSSLRKSQSTEKYKGNFWKSQTFERKTANFTCSLVQCHIDLLSPYLNSIPVDPICCSWKRRKSSMGRLKTQKTSRRVSKEDIIACSHFTDEKTDEKKSQVCCLDQLGSSLALTGIRPKQLSISAHRLPPPLRWTLRQEIKSAAGGPEWAEAGPERGDRGPLPAEPVVMLPGLAVKARLKQPLHFTVSHVGCLCKT